MGRKKTAAAPTRALDMGEIRTYPLNKTVVGPENTRKHIDLGQPIDDLATSIASVGLLQPLIGTDWGGEARIVGGQRRWLAMQRLVLAGKMAKDAPIPVRVMDHDRAHEASLAENYMRQQMTTQDLYLALKQLTELRPHAPLSALADAFAIGEDRARRILRLANLAPPIMEAWSKGELDTKRVQAYAFTDKHEIQLEVFNSPDAQYHADYIRRAIQRLLAGDEPELLTAELKALDRDEYKKRGGEIIEDLFGENTAFTNVALAREILHEQRDKALSEFLASITYEDGTPIDYTIGDLPQVNRYGYEQDDRDLFVDVEETLAEEALVRAGEIEAALKALADEEIEEEEFDQRSAELDAELDALPRKRTVNVPVGTPLIAEGGFDWHGEIEVTLAQTSREAAGLPPIAPPTPVGLKVGADSTGSAETDTKINDGLSQRTLNVLKGMRQAAIRRGIFDTDIDGERAADAHKALIHALARGMRTHTSRVTHMVHNAEGNQYQNTDYKPAIASFDGNWISEPDPIRSFQMFCELTPQQIDQVAADLFARKVEGSLYQPGQRTVPHWLSTVRSDPMMARRVIDLDKDFFGMFKKKQIIGFFEEALGDKMSDTFRGKLNKAKAASLVDYAVACFNPDGNHSTIKLLGLTPHKALLRDWIPSWLRFDGVYALAQAAPAPKVEIPSNDECKEDREPAVDDDATAELEETDS